MKMLTDMRKRGAIPAMARVILIVLIIAVAIAPVSFSSPAGLCSTHRDIAAAGASHCCCPAKDCSCARSNPHPQQPLGILRAGSSQQLLSAALPFTTPLLYQFPTATARIQYSRDNFPRRGDTPLAQSCIQLI